MRAEWTSVDVRQTPIDGAFEIVPAVFRDSRGYFKEVFARSRYAQLTQNDFVQDNVSRSCAWTLRGLHADLRMAKLVQVLEGAAFDVIVDLRKASPSYLKWYGATLRAGEHTQLYIPAGCLHGFLALEDNTILLYKQTAEYDPTQEIGVAWDDPNLAIDWPLEGREPLLSAKDARNPILRELGYL